LARASALSGPIIKCSIIISGEILGNMFVCVGNMYLHIKNDGLGPECESKLFLFCRTVYMAQTHC